LRGGTVVRLKGRHARLHRERASLIVTSNKPFSAWGEIFGDDAVAVAE
jgi:DNA replication protein DnaC